jgi:hypothetical protein
MQGTRTATKLADCRGLRSFEECGFIQEERSYFKAMALLDLVGKPEDTLGKVEDVLSRCSEAKIG